jgi:subtilisin family serine protease
MHRSLAVRLTAFALTSSLLAACGGGGGGGGSVPPGGGGHGGSTPTPPPVYVSCAQSGVSPSSVSQKKNARSAMFASVVRRHAVYRFTGSTVGSDTLIGVTYALDTASSSGQAISARESAAGAHFVRSMTFTHAGLVTHVLSVSPGQAATVEAALRGQPGVQSVGAVDARRFPTSVSQAYWPNDPYYDGFSTTVAPTPGATDPPATYHVPPYDESASVPGQWGMHAVCLGYAFDYSQSGNGSGITNASALGSGSIKIAIIDTGQDLTHPELSSKVVYYRTCLNGAACTASDGDEWGHGTDTAGIAAADMNNSLGFVGAGGNAVIYGYRVFPTPDANCFSNPNTNDNNCTAGTQDIADAIQDAISQHVNVISMSLGGSCPDDNVEGPAIEDAIADNIIVVAAAGNDGSEGLDAPACDSGVISVGATGLADGQLNGDENRLGSAASPIEYVASYSNWGTPAADAGSSSAWGIVAPGGDPASDSDLDDLHWIENIWTSTPFGGQNGDDAGTCTGDYPTDTGTDDCRIDIAGTSMATPMVAGAAALILSVNPSYQSPAAMKQLLCETADDIEDGHEGCGRLNVYRAMAKALADPTLP